jgi:hypothetical protein
MDITGESWSQAVQEGFLIRDDFNLRDGGRRPDAAHSKMS